MPKNGSNICTTSPSIALLICPFTCGLCNRPGVSGICPDESDNCAAIFRLDPIRIYGFHKEILQKEVWT
ncbi:unnamed protein product [Dracunculus medinensis]|uniref:ShKT domain-containing protein n=1 Tax=Dracunculus medinensis TaxID=318479 RepID=A0A0N4US13_DRAME|nr:unnamed protein product [Dracunculus medinensis]